MNLTKKLKVKGLTLEAFRPFGTYASLTPPMGKPLVGDGTAISFWPDCGGVLNTGPFGGNTSIGVCQAKWRELSIDTAEFHNFAGEGILPLDGDIYLHVAAPTADGCVPKTEDFEVFFVPKGTMIILKPGVYHHAPFSTDKTAVVNTQILLPQRTYAIDCWVKNVDPPVEFER